MSRGVFHAVWAEAFPSVAAIEREVYPSVAAVEIEAGYRPRPKRVVPNPLQKEQKK